MDFEGYERKGQSEYAAFSANVRSFNNECDYCVDTGREVQSAANAMKDGQFGSHLGQRAAAGIDGTIDLGKQIRHLGGAVGSSSKAAFVAAMCLLSVTVHAGPPDWNMDDFSGKGGSLTVIWIALAHGIPVFITGFASKKRWVLVATAIAMAFVALATGNAKYAVFDLMAIAGVTFLGWQVIGGPRSEPQRTKDEARLPLVHVSERVRAQPVPPPPASPAPPSKPEYSTEQLQSAFKSVNWQFLNAKSDEERQKSLVLLAALAERQNEDAARLLRESYTYGINGVRLDRGKAMYWAKKFNLITAGLGGGGVDFVESDEYELVTCLDDIFDVAMRVAEHRGFFFCQHVFLTFWNTDNPLWRQRALEVAIQSAAAHVHLMPDLAELYYSIETKEGKFFACALWTAAMKMGGRLQSLPSIIVENNDKDMNPCARLRFDKIVGDLIEPGKLVSVIDKYAPKLVHGAAFAIEESKAQKKSNVNAEWQPSNQAETEIDRFARSIFEEFRASGLIPKEAEVGEHNRQKAIFLDYTRARLLPEGAYALGSSQGWKGMYERYGSYAGKIEEKLYRRAGAEGIITPDALAEYLEIKAYADQLRGELK